MSGARRIQKVVVINGWSANSSMWSNARDSLKHLAADVEIVDLNSSGVLDDFDSVLKEKITPNTLIVAWSLGAQMVIETLLRSRALSESIAGFIALQATPCFVERQDWNVGYSSDSFDSLYNLCAENELGRVRRTFVHLLVSGSDDSKSDRRFLKEKYLGTDLADNSFLLKGLHLLKENDLRHDIETLQVRTLWLIGEKDALVSSDLELELSSVKAGEVEVISGMGHFPCGVYWNRVFESIQRFIEEE